LPVKVKRTKKDEAFAPQPPQHQESGIPNFYNVVGQYNKLGEFFDKKHSFTELAQHLGDIAEYAEQTLTNERADDWFDAHTIKRNSAEMRKYAGDFQKIAKEADQHIQRMHAYYEDMGNVLERYFEIMDDEDPTEDPTNTPIDTATATAPVAQPQEQAMKESGKAFTHSTHAGKEEAIQPTTESAFHQKYAPQIHERVIEHLRKKLSSIQCERFNTLSPERQFEMAWRFVK
jgi:hypothetical protein